MKEIIALNKEGQKPVDLKDFVIEEVVEEPVKIEFDPSDFEDDEDD